MTKIDPTHLIAEAQARETALNVALKRIADLERAFVTGLVVMFVLGCLFGMWAAVVSK